MAKSAAHAETAAHEWGHVYAARAAGLRTGSMHVTGHGGYVNVATPTAKEQVAGYQVMCMAGQIAMERWQQENGGSWRDGGEGDRELFAQWAGKPGAISMGRARTLARGVVDRDWSAIQAHARTYEPEATR